MRSFTFSDPAWIGLIGGGSVAGSTSFSFVGTSLAQGWTVPAGVTQVTAKLWGSAGSGRMNSIGGFGGFCTGTFAVTAGQVMEVRVGFGGGRGAGSGDGGGYAWVSYPSGSPTSWLIAAGGGGAGSGASNAIVNGGAGGVVGVSGNSLTAIFSFGGSGALAFAAGAGGVPDEAAHSGFYLAGGSGLYSSPGLDYNRGAGGGGGGLYGGGGGASYFIDAQGGGGGGGCNLVSGAIAGLSISTSGRVGFTDANWNGTAGSGAAGYVYLSYS